MDRRTIHPYDDNGSELVGRGSYTRLLGTPDNRLRRSYPLMLDLDGKTVVIVGGGLVAVRKAKGTLEAGANVTVVSPTVHETMPSGVCHEAALYHSGCLVGASLVFAATNDSAVNTQVVRDARALGVLVSRADADDTEPGDFSTPARWTDGVATVAVSAGNAALAAVIRDGLGERWDPRWTKLAQAMADVRPAMIDRSDLTQPQRARIFRKMASEESMQTLAEHGLAVWQAWALALQPDP